MLEMEKKKKENIDLIKYLSSLGYAKNKAKTYVRLGFVKVNGKEINKLPYLLKENDIVKIEKKEEKNYNIHIVYEDDHYLVVDKEAGLLTISTSNQTKKEEDTLYKRVRAYLNHKHEYAFIVNRWPLP